ncbi:MULTISPECIES: ABC transporter permease [unclassified Cryobacterium]|uniref:ABC transporter permease n=1 Tax=unclassified Cryobacterium TaxID=2649013 RepID=UPI002B2370C2|nr:MULTISPECIES: ABC transporter permease [unclassified Cryobacterium]MEA9998891.1 ABC transporter permease [Cryobacterium sp. RTS3]MEB0265752.1 ABC transporter permease [Cryobacterium sp. 10I5]
MARHNLGTVVSFEVTRTLKKKQFWLTTLLVPVVIGIVIALIVLSNTSTESKVDSQKDATLRFTYSDASGYIDPAIATAFGGTLAADPDQAIADVKSGVSAAHFSYPAQPTKEATTVYGTDVGIFDNGKYSSVATQLMVASAQAKIGDPTLTGLARGSFQVDAVTYKDGAVSGGILGAVAPLLFLLIFYVVIVMLGNQMLTSTLEEKENRVTEMILTTLNPTTLIMGKIISLFIIGIVQMLVFILPVLVGYLFFRTSLSLPDVDLSQLIVNPGQMVVGALLLIGGFTLFMGTLVAAGAIMPTAKEASQVFGIVMALVFVPLYAVSLVVSDPHALIVQLFTFFPYSAPVTAMLRNGLGSLSPLESGIVIAELFLLGGIVLRLAVQLFRYGSVEYTKRVSLRTVFARSRR